MPSKELLGIQLADFLMGALNGKVNGKITSEAKKEIIERIEIRLGHEIMSTPKLNKKFNVFKIKLQKFW